MTFSMKPAAIVLTLLTVFVSGVASAEATFTPGRFGDGEKSLGKLIRFPELRGDTTVAISCTGILTGRGKLDQHSCYRRNPGDETFITEILRGSRKARLIPATYNGRTVDVVFQYRVQFKKEGEELTLQFAANPGYEENVEAYGSGHIAAQRVMAKENWQKSCPRQAKFLVLARANVDYDGTPGAVTIQPGTGIPITETCRAALEQTMLNSRFIPAFADGEAVPSTYLEPFGN